MLDLKTFEIRGDYIIIKDTDVNILKNYSYAEICDFFNVKGIMYYKNIILNDFRVPNVQFLYRERFNNIITYKENGLKYTYDITQNMLSCGNVNEKNRMLNINGDDDIIVDLFAGIGYFTIPLLKNKKLLTSKVVAIDWNPHALYFLNKNIILNGIDPNRCEIIFGNNQKVTPSNIANRVILGLIPSSYSSWMPAIKALKFELKNDSDNVNIHNNNTNFCNRTKKLNEKILHIHQNCDVLGHSQHYFTKFFTKLDQSFKLGPYSEDIDPFSEPFINSLLENLLLSQPLSTHPQKDLHLYFNKQESRFNCDAFTPVILIPHLRKTVDLNSDNLSPQAEHMLSNIYISNDILKKLCADFLITHLMNITLLAKRCKHHKDFYQLLKTTSIPKAQTTSHINFDNKNNIENNLNNNNICSNLNSNNYNNDKPSSYLKTWDRILTLLWIFRALTQLYRFATRALNIFTQVRNDCDYLAEDNIFSNCDLNGYRVKITLLDLIKVKSYGPKITHYVLDVKVDYFDRS